MPELSDLVSLHSGQVENFYLLVLGQVQMYTVNPILYQVCGNIMPELSDLVSFHSEQVEISISCPGTSTNVYS